MHKGRKTQRWKGRENLREGEKKKVGKVEREREKNKKEGESEKGRKMEREKGEERETVFCYTQERERAGHVTSSPIDRINHLFG
jgi:hypothetical protein